MKQFNSFWALGGLNSGIQIGMDWFQLLPDRCLPPYPQQIVSKAVLV